MTPMKAKNPQFITPEFRVSFPNVFQARAVIQGQDPKFSIVMLFDKKTDITLLKKAAVAAIVEKWGPKESGKWPKDLRLPFKEGSEKDYAGYENMIAVNASSSKEQKPGIVDQSLQDIIDPSEFYGGCYARATIAAFAYDKLGNRGVSFGLRNLQKLRDGEHLGGKNAANKDFDAIEVGEVQGAGADVDLLADIGA